MGRARRIATITYGCFRAYPYRVSHQYSGRESSPRCERNNYPVQDVVIWRNKDKHNLNNIIYLIGLIVVVLAILSFLGLS